MKIIFMGTPDFSVPCLKKLCLEGHEVAAVFTQPDKPKGRGHKMLPPPVKQAAEELGIEVYQPVSLKKGEDAEKSLEIINKIAPDLIVVVAFGQILPKTVLDAPKFGCINVHASLLPKYRGAAPMQWCILNGEKKTGVTTMMMDVGLDTGDMLLKKEVEIGENETLSELHDDLSQTGAELLIETIRSIENETITRTPQNDSESTYSPMITKDMSLIDFKESAQSVHNRIRAITGFAFIDHKRIKLLGSCLTGKKSDETPGTVCSAEDFSVVCGDGEVIRFTEVQPEGGKRLKTADFLRGNKLEKGTVLESE